MGFIFELSKMAIWLVDKILFIICLYIMLSAPVIQEHLTHLTLEMYPHPKKKDTFFKETKDFISNLK